MMSDGEKVRQLRGNKTLDYINPYGGPASADPNGR